MEPSHSCECVGCKTLDQLYGDNFHLYSFYRQRLLIRGWAGKLSDAELIYVKAHAPWARTSSDRMINARMSNPTRPFQPV